MGLFRSVISKLKAGLTRTRQALTSGLRSLILGRRLDEALLADVEKMLLEADVGVAATRRLLEGARDDFRAGKLTRSEDLLEHLKRELKTLLGGPAVEMAQSPSGPTVILVTGINGAGKTTSIAKLAAKYRAAGKSVLLGACDTFRAGAVRQLEIWSERLGVEVVKGQQGGDPAAVAFDAAKAAAARNVDVLIIDTAGRLQTQDPLMRQLGKIRSVIGRQIPGAPHETLLVLDATTGQNALRQAEEFSRHAQVTGIFLAKLDGTAKGGIVAAIRHGTQIPVKFVGVGETPEDVEPFDADAFVEALLGE
ncbi:MAG: signal recognition particle-docking protein FtsY [Phycisphaeraceae bacterium]|nr:signal recognition particle-docking protein FtsY [Phycisphaeraceae bacterium]